MDSVTTTLKTASSLRPALSSVAGQCTVPAWQRRTLQENKIKVYKWMKGSENFYDNYIFIVRCYQKKGRVLIRHV